jgi:hypothetical protein
MRGGWEGVLQPLVLRRLHFLYTMPALLQLWVLGKNQEKRIKKQETRSKKQEERSKRQEARGKKQET